MPYNAVLFIIIIIVINTLVGERITYIQPRTVELDNNNFIANSQAW